MILAGVFGALLFLALVVGDWLYFSSTSAQAGTYGCRIAGAPDREPWPTLAEIGPRFDTNGLIRLPNGFAHLFPTERRIVLRSQQGFLPSRFRTAWPLKATLELEPEGRTTRVTCIKRIPWSSAILTSSWFLIVGAGTLTFVVMYLADGGLASLSTILMGLGILGIGLLVLAFGLVTIALAYRLENHRLTLAYRDLRAALEPSSGVQDK
ncbi:MAG: hypothetical protein KGO52_03200 [Nitrospirota bacterium]|nr:hypothetical protein [Nitrospirota bacterium]MDE3118425.1 hypothetical protein [Nitrospirota bacterium]MDE3241711.1 hypothetical protein [Nitrospirota bacterium]